MRAVRVIAIIGTMVGCTEKKQDINAAWLKEQTALVDGVCACTDAFKTPPSPPKADAFEAQTAQAAACIEQKQVGLLVATSPSGIEAGVDGNDLYQRPEVKQLKARWSDCAQQVEIRRRVEQDLARPLAR